MFLACISLCPESEYKVRPVNLESNLNGTPPKAIPGQKLSQALKQHHQLAFWYFQKNKLKGVHSEKTKIPMAHLQESGRLSQTKFEINHIEITPCPAVTESETYGIWM